ncbi:NAD-dependent protein deacylase [Paenibacillus thermotolerans]|uniref:NAD-dependent protein deacylase n=1 Tax=Paenibacillus thermotolerans TaxID=3027807 RepID=UPI00236790FE|nr:MULTISPECIES: NAD-dependent protein deacylase [unclassified Paenibacillus]
MEKERIRSIIEQGRRIVFFGGAGTSTESGIPDFRSASGLYAGGSGTPVPPETILSRSFFVRQPEAFYTFYRSKMIYREARPNAAHRALAELERRGKLSAVVTQNIDGLHQAAGSRTVFELHGSVHRNYCMSCRAFYDLDYIVDSEDAVPVCSACGGTVKPDVVLYEEPLDAATWEGAAEQIAKADVLIVGGTSLTVHPAASLVTYYQGDKFIIINRDETPYDEYASVICRESIGSVLGDAVN